MKNPYDEMEHHPSEVTFGGKKLLYVAAFFVLGISVVPLSRYITEFSKEKEARWFPIIEIWKHPNQRSFNQLFQKKAKSSLVTREEPNIRDHLQSFEEGIEDTAFKKPIQQSEQAILSNIFKKGNHKVVWGKNGWLYYQAAIDAVVGKGPLQPEPDSVTKDPDRPEWQNTLPVIERFALQLRDRGIDLMIVPIPVKPMVQPEGLGINKILKHPDQDRFYNELRSRGIIVVDLLPTLANAKNEGDVFLRQDTHWTAEAARRCAHLVGDEVKKMEWYASTERNLRPNYQTIQRSSKGDLVGMLGLPENDKTFAPESQTLEQVFDEDTGRTVEGDLMSPISVIGDSFINIYEDPGLGFGDESDGGLIGAGFGSHLSAHLEMQAHISALNGEGATGVRQLFCSLPDNVVRSKKLVIWAIASRDFLLSESAANRAGVFWRDVEFNTNSEELPRESNQTEPDDDGHIILTGTLKQKSFIQDPGVKAYHEAIYSTIFEDLEVETGEYSGEEILIFLWAFKEFKLSPSSQLEIGKRYRLKLIPMAKEVELTRKTQLDDFSARYDLTQFFAMEVTSHQ